MSCECLHLQLLKSDLVSFDSWLFIPSDSLCINLTPVLFFPTCPKIKSFLKKMPSGNGRLSSHNVPPQYRTHSYYSSYLSQGIDTAACVPPSTCSEPKAAGQSRTHTHALRAINFYPEIINSVSKYIWGRFILWVKGAVKFIKINKFKGKTFMSIICSGDFRFKETRTMC